MLKPSPKKTNSPKTLFQRKQQGPRLTSSKLASSKNSKFDNTSVKRNHSINNKRGTESVDGNDSKNNTLQPKKQFKKNPLGRSSDDLLKIDYHAIEEERQKEVLVRFSYISFVGQFLKISKSANCFEMSQSGFP